MLRTAARRLRRPWLRVPVGLLVRRVNGTGFARAAACAAAPTYFCGNPCTSAPKYRPRSAGVAAGVV